MSDEITGDSDGARHLTARQLAEQAIAAEQSGDADEAERWSRPSTWWELVVG